MNIQPIANQSYNRSNYTLKKNTVPNFGSASDTQLLQIVKLVTQTKTNNVNNIRGILLAAIISGCLESSGSSQPSGKRTYTSVSDYFANDPDFQKFEAESEERRAHYERYCLEHGRKPTDGTDFLS